jgi:phosphoenolpyruvate carboxylase
VVENSLWEGVPAFLRELNEQVEEAFGLSCIAWRVMAAVTLGLPSRSPPIHEVNCTGTKSTGSRKYRPTPIDEAKWGFAVVENSLWEGVPAFLRELNEQVRRKAGTPSHKLFSTTAKPHLASSIGVGRYLRISSVCQARAGRRSLRD